MDAAKYICSEKHLNCKITQISLKKTSRSFWRHFSNRSYPKVKITLAYLNIIRIV